MKRRAGRAYPKDWFKEQFRGITLYSDGDLIRYAAAGSEGQVDAITGATATSSAVIDILNESIKQAKPE